MGVAVTNLAKSVEFYQNLGFIVEAAAPATDKIAYLINSSGMRLHLLQTSRAAEGGKNLLQDLGDTGEKYPGHTHMAFGVFSVPKVREYVETRLGIPLSGTRGGLSIFIRDPDRTTLEFERNDGGVKEGEGRFLQPADEAERALDRAEAEDEDLASPHFFLKRIPRGGLDHIGTRVSDPPSRLLWYEQVLGLTRKLLYYEHDAANPRANMRPWVVRSDHRRLHRTPRFSAHFPWGDDDEQRLMNEFDENLIINGTVGKVNVLLSPSEDPLPGIIFAAITVDNLDAFVARYRASQPADSIIPEAESASWGIPAHLISHVPSPSYFIRDPDLSVFRIIQEAEYPVSASS